jgi:hypothetical protein
LPPEREALPMVVEPSLNVTVPVGVPEPGGNGLTVAVNVTAWLPPHGLREEVNNVFVAALLISWTSVGETPPEKFASPP